ncbi:Plasmid stabilization system protein ParE [Prevotellaceae bacterium HUN156]|jgi:plasmid stabilization system protein ParE|nr:Plasmid stabilization system protein ParE [Prevotellaceae bacterium HUN156]
MQVEVSKRAQRQWIRILVYYNEMGGERAAANLHLKYLQKQKRLLKYPESGSLEPLLSDKKIRYRSLIINDYYKLIYYVKGDILRIAAFWDMRMHPDNLRKTI